MNHDRFVQVWRVMTWICSIPVLCLLLSSSQMVSTYAAPSAAPAAVFPSSTVTPSPVTASADRCTYDYMPSSAGQLVIWIWLNGKTPARFILDTGTNVSIITEKLADKLGLKRQPTIGADGVPLRFDGKQAQTVIVPMMQVGTIHYPNFPLIVVNGESINGPSEDGIDGLVGMTALASDPVFIDFQKHKITLFYNGPITADQLRSVSMDTAACVPLNDHDGNLDFRAAVQLANGDKKATAELTVDTGGSDTITPEATARTLGLRAGPNQDYSAVVSNATVRTIALTSVSFGPPSTDIGPLNAFSFQGHTFTSLPPHVGLDVLTHFQVLLDFGGRKMYLKPVPAPPLNLTYVHPAPTP